MNSGRFEIYNVIYCNIEQVILAEEIKLGQNYGNSPNPHISTLQSFAPNGISILPRTPIARIHITISLYCMWYITGINCEKKYLWIK